MPYLTNEDLPEPVRRHLPPHAQDIYREAFNHAHDRYGLDREAIAHRIAWAAVKKTYEKVGDVWTEYPLDAEGRPRPSPVRNRPTLILFVRTDAGEIPLVRWPTTIGAWQPEKIEEDVVVPRYKASPTGRRYWRDLLVAPAWFPPPSTPDREFVRRRPDGTWALNDDAIGPGYRSAYGLVALLHHRAVVTPDGATLFADIEIRTHGSGNYRSILRGSSHGCHRLFNHLALRLGSFLLAHQEFARHGLVEEHYRRTVRWKGHRFVLRARARGYRYELVSPVPVDVLPGRIVRARRSPEPPAETKPIDLEPHASTKRPSPGLGTHRYVDIDRPPAQEGGSLISTVAVSAEWQNTQLLRATGRGFAGSAR